MTSPAGQPGAGAVASGLSTLPHSAMFEPVGAPAWGWQAAGAAIIRTVGRKGLEMQGLRPRATYQPACAKRSRFR